MKKSARKPPRNGQPPGKKRAQQPGATTVAKADAESAKNGRCFVVAVGASAGGLEAFTELLRPLPANPGLAFVLIPHLDPTHESAMCELLSHSTKMAVREVHDGMNVTPDCVYVIPPNRSMTIQEGVLRLVERQAQGGGPPMPIDGFFRSLAMDCGRNAVGVILSGTASDGTLGVAAIKNEGGITFAQDQESARYDGMPNSAVASGHIDFVLPPAQIARELLRIRKHPYVTHSEDNAREEQQGTIQSQMRQIFRLLHQVRRVDFSDYKPGTIRRRILRRMALTHQESVADYARLLQHSRGELEALHNDILINVTSFFRDPQVFEALKENVYPAILQARSQSDTIRVWVPGCSTGEEAYSHAISLVEYVTKIRSDVSIQIFGTDLSDSAVRIARAGSYKDAIAQDVTAVRLRRFFTKTEHGYQISKSIRDMCVFATQNVFNDPPFSRMDLVSCRNVLIYLGQALQKRVIPIFHYALNPTGYLMVGNTEGLVGTGADLFEPVDREHKIYRKRMGSPQVAFGFPRERTEPQVPLPPDRTAGEPVRTPIDLHREADRLLLLRYVPAAVVVNEQLDIVQVRGKVGKYLELPSGKASLNLMKMAKSGLLFELQRMLDEAKEKRAAVRHDNVRFEVDGKFELINVEVIPFQSPLQTQHSFILVFEEGTPLPKVEKPAVTAPPDAAARQVTELKQELAATKEYLQSIIEALEATNEELQSANEEIQSGNEELQSTNEELQTSKEELESANEELNTVNDEMQNRNVELGQLNNDLLNLLSSVNIPIVMLDSELSIRRVTPQTEEVLGILPSDVGRPLRQVRLKTNVPGLHGMMLDVIESLQPQELTVQVEPNRRYRLRIRPYHTMDHRIEGVVLVFLEGGATKEKSAKQASLGAQHGGKAEKS